MPVAAHDKAALLKIYHSRGSAKESGRRWWVIDPRVSSAIGWWDAVAGLALIFTAIVTPFEVAFLPPVDVTEGLHSPLFLLNRLIYLIFITDMLLQLCVAYQVHAVNPVSPSLIRCPSHACQYVVSLTRSAIPTGLVVLRRAHPTRFTTH